MMETPRHINLFFIVLTIIIYCVYSFPSENNATTQTSMQKLISANNEFSLNLHRSLGENCGRNIFFSPISLFLAFGMLYKGANGETAQELRNVLGFSEVGLSDEEVDESFNQLMAEILNSSENFTLKTANAILVDPQLNLVYEYEQTVSDLNNTIVKNVNFQDRNQVIPEINRWISKQTDGKISEFLEDLDPSTVMMILNAIYFKGLWSIPFKKGDTRKERFYNYGGENKSKVVPMMHSSHRILYTSAPEWDMVELPYKGDRISMVIILPKQRNGLSDVEKSLTPEEIRKYRNRMRMSTVNFTLPTFKIESSHYLNAALSSLGIEKMFQYDADFSRMVQNGPVRVSHVMQKALVEVNEEGTVAAAVSGVYLVPLSLSVPRVFKADHPFLFAILDKKTNLILFTGRVIAL